MICQCNRNLKKGNLCLRPSMAVGGMVVVGRGVRQAVPTIDDVMFSVAGDRNDPWPLWEHSARNSSSEASDRGHEDLLIERDFSNSKFWVNLLASYAPGLLKDVTAPDSSIAIRRFRSLGYACRFPNRFSPFLLGLRAL